MIHFAGISLVHTPILLNASACWESSNTEACAKKLPQILANNIENGAKEMDLKIYVKHCLKK